MFEERIVVLRWDGRDVEGESLGNPGLFRLSVAFAYLPEKKGFRQKKVWEGREMGSGFHLLPQPWMSVLRNQRMTNSIMRTSLFDFFQQMGRAATNER